MKTAKTKNPSRESLREIPEIDFTRYGPPRANPFAKHIKAKGRTLVHEGPSRASLKEMPETDFSRVKSRSNPYAKRIKTEGLELQVRPRQGAEVGPTVVDFSGKPHITPSSP